MLKEIPHDIKDLARAEAREVGYSVEEVDAYTTSLMEDYQVLLSGADTSKISTSRSIRAKMFNSEPGGYVLADVDAMMERVEDIYAETERDLYIDTYGEETWLKAVAELRDLLLGRLSREPGQRFRRPARRLTKGYYVKDVDAFCRRMMLHMQAKERLSVDDIRRTVFTSGTGSMAYEESQVDAFMDRCIEYLQDTA
ncbi:DivIVA domain-containing protein [Rothia nasimurium]|uniref:DivIVA domain-containing protein n=1 Tax=Rothia nasimurium TaxID=85336 RepID=UPI001F3AF8EB|nr:DivIVA domain-containing protein [Rothia nasimurium]